MKEECQSNASLLKSETVHDAQYARFYEVNESDVGALLKNISKTLLKEELADHLTVQKGKINKDCDMIGTSKRKTCISKNCEGPLGKC